MGECFEFRDDRRMDFAPHPVESYQYLVTFPDLRLIWQRTHISSIARRKQLTFRLGVIGMVNFPNFVPSAKQTANLLTFSLWATRTES